MAFEIDNQAQRVNELCRWIPAAMHSFNYSFIWA